MTHAFPVLGLRWLPCVFLALMVGIVVYGWFALAQNRNTPPPPPTSPGVASQNTTPNSNSGTNPEPIQAAQAKIAAEQAKIAYEQDALEKRIATLQTELGWVLAAVGLFTLIQGAFAALSAYNFVQQAERNISEVKDKKKEASDLFTTLNADAVAAVGEIKDRQNTTIEKLDEVSRQMKERSDGAVAKIEELARDVRGRYPMFHRAEEARREAFRSLAPLIENGDWRERLYDQLGVQQRQRLLSVENFIGLEFLESSDEIASDLRLMGNFYASKYVSEERRNAADLDRAQYYIELALARTERAFYHLNDYGLLHFQIMKPPKFDVAEPHFLESQGKRREHQRAAYNLANIAHERGNKAADPKEKLKHYFKAHDLLQEALKYDVWEVTKSAEREGNIHYNLACCLARLSQWEENNDPVKKLAEALAELRSAARIGSTKSKTLLYDLNDKDGDLIALANSSDASVQKDLSGVKIAFNQVWAKRGQPLL